MPYSGYPVCLNADNTLLASPANAEGSVYARPCSWLGDTLYGVESFGSDDTIVTALWAIGTKGGTFNFVDRPHDHPDIRIATAPGDFTQYITTVDDGLVMYDGSNGLWKATFSGGDYQSSDVGVVTDEGFSTIGSVDSGGRPEVQVVRNDVLMLASVAIGQPAAQIALFADSTEYFGAAYGGLVITPRAEG